MGEDRYNAPILIKLELVGPLETLVRVYKSCSTTHLLKPPEIFGAQAKSSLTLAEGIYDHVEKLQEVTKNNLKLYLPILSDAPKIQKRLVIVLQAHTAGTDFSIDSRLLKLLTGAQIPVMVVVYKDLGPHIPVEPAVWVPYTSSKSG